MSDTQRSFVPAAGRDWLLPLYDPLTWLMGAKALHRVLLEQADIRPGQRVLEIGCGTGNLLLEGARRQPEAEWIGLDPDPKALARARRKAERAELAVQLVQGFSDALPCEDASLDRVLSAFMLHHLDLDAKRATLREAARALRPGGRLHVLDFGGAHDSGGVIARLFHRAEHVRDNLGERIPALMREAGLAEPVEVASRGTIFGRVAYWRAGARPAPSRAGAGAR